jgi:hypothetical protein
MTHLHEGHKLGDAALHQEAQRVLHAKPHKGQEAAQLAEAVRLKVAFCQVVPALAHILEGGPACSMPCQRCMLQSPAHYLCQTGHVLLQAFMPLLGLT